MNRESQNSGGTAFAAAPLRDFDEVGRKEFWASLALKHCKGLGIRKISRLLNSFGGAFASVERVDEWAARGINAECAREFKSGRWREAAKAEWGAALKLTASVVVWASEDYPDLLRQLPDAPLFLYCLGDLELLLSPSVGVVGSRNPSRESAGYAARLAGSLAAAGVTVISGMASGIDAAAHAGALDEVGGSVGVLGTGIDIRYPLANKNLFERMEKSGLLVSEFAPGSPPVNYNFPIRNRIISGLSVGVIVVEAAARSGSLITARFAIEQNREVLAVPGEPFNDRSLGCQNLIRSGAHPVFNVEDALKALSGPLKTRSVVSVARARRGESKNAPLASASLEPPPVVKPAPASKPEIPLAPEVSRNVSGMERSDAILDILRRRESWQAEDLASEAKMSAQELNSVLIIMEIQGKIKRLDGANYAAIV